MERSKNVPPLWGREAKKALVDRGVSIKDFAEEMGYSREHVSGVINGRVRSPDMQARICSHLGIAESSA